MEIRRENKPVDALRVELLAVPLFGGSGDTPELARLDAATGGKLLREIRKRSSDPAKQGSVSLYHTHGELAAELIAVIGMGKPDAETGVSLASWRGFGARAYDAAQAARARSVGVSVASAAGGNASGPAGASARAGGQATGRSGGDAGGDSARISAAGAVIEGAQLATYRFRQYKTSKTPEAPTRYIVVGVPMSRVAELVERRARIVAEATCMARDLINQPADVMTPAALGRAALELARGRSLTTRVLGPRELGRLGMRAILAVGRGSANPPCLIELVYRPGRSRRAARAARAGGGARGHRHVALIGKGITFDSGGLSLKPPGSMEIQKRDMSGGAAVLGAMRAIAELGPAIEVRGYVPSAENMPGGTAYRPGDVIRSFGGKTIEVLNTDAEGRLVLADALGYAAAGASRRGAPPEWIVDLATLTGAVRTALGNSVAAVMGNHATLVQRVIGAGREAGEPIWELPLIEEYVPAMESHVADLRNTGDGTAGAIFGGLFLREFVNQVPWAHLDIAAVAYADKAQPGVPRGAVGWGVRTLVNLVERAASEVLPGSAAEGSRRSASGQRRHRTPEERPRPRPAARSPRPSRARRGRSKAG